MLISYRGRMISRHFAGCWPITCSVRFWCPGTEHKYCKDGTVADPEGTDKKM